MATAGKLRGHKALALKRDLADKKLSQTQLAEKYEVTQGAISEFGRRYKDDIDAIIADFDNEYAGIWAANKANRLTEYQADVDMINEQLETVDNPRNLRTLLQFKQAALRSIAEELGHLTQKVETKNSTTTYIVEGVDTEAMK
jgi:transcriptional regulator with XRE-family HTH domain